MTEPLTLTKLIILYMLHIAGTPILKTQVLGFITENDYTNYFTLMQACGELCDAKFIEMRMIMNGPHLAILPDGEKALDSFSDRISHGIKDDIVAFFAENHIETKSTLNVNTNYYKAAGNEYIAELSLKDDGMEQLLLRIAMPTEEAVVAMCENFEEKSEELYNLIVDKLLQS